MHDQVDYGENCSMQIHSADCYCLVIICCYNLYKLGSFNFRCTVDYPSEILFGKLSFITQLKQWLPPLHRGLMLCYRSSKDGWSSNTFHSGCDNKGPTVTIIRVHSYIFGGYADISWGGKYIIVILKYSTFPSNECKA